MQYLGDRGGKGDGGGGGGGGKIRRAGAGGRMEVRGEDLGRGGEVSGKVSGVGSGEDRRSGGCWRNIGDRRKMDKKNYRGLIGDQG